MEFSIRMIFQECRPDQNIRYLNVLGHIIGVGLPRSHSAQLPLARNSTRCSGRRVLISNSVKYVGQLWCGLADLIHNVFIAVAESMACPKFLYKVEVLGTASCNDF
jgi:hypothetical protein